ncbi:MAG: phage terminase large subunit, partial [Pirellulales bacterium]|nr:phage terminase large subunit [Pirellulales bacterium]
VSPRLKLKRILAPLLSLLHNRSGDRSFQHEVPLQLDTLTWGRRYLSSYFRNAPSEMHRWLGQKLDAIHETRGAKINVIGPRGGAKSTIGTLCYALRAAVEGWEPYIWIVSDTKNQAQTHLENIKNELEENDLLAQDYPQAVGRGPCWRATMLELRNGTVVESFGTGQRLRGRRRRENRPTLIVCDDLQNDGHMVSAAQRDSSSQWFHGTLLKAGTKHTNILNLATALHRDALAMQLHRSPGWNSRMFRAIVRWPSDMKLWSEWEEIYCDTENAESRQVAKRFYEEHRLAMHQGAVLLWPEEEDLYTLMKMRVEEGRTAFEREKQSSPIDPERCEWPEEYFAEHIWFQQWPTELQLKTLALDPSKGSDGRQGDYSAFVVLGIDHQGVLYVEADLARRPTPQMVSDGVSLCQRHRVDAFGVEANQYQDLLAGEFQAEFSRHGIKQSVPCAIHNHVNKQVRIRRLGPYLSQRRLRFRAGSPSTQLLVEQLRDFPLGAHDDGPDALEMALRLAEELYHGNSIDDGLGSRIPIG